MAIFSLKFQLSLSYFFIIEENCVPSTSIQKSSLATHVIKLDNFYYYWLQLTSVSIIATRFWLWFYHLPLSIIYNWISQYPQSSESLNLKLQWACPQPFHGDLDLFIITNNSNPSITSTPSIPFQNISSHFSSSDITTLNQLFTVFHLCSSYNVCIPCVLVILSPYLA